MKIRARTGLVQTARWLLTILALAVAAATAQSGEAKADAKSENKLVGTWKLVSAKYGGEEFKFEEGLTTVNHVLGEGLLPGGSHRRLFYIIPSEFNTNISENFTFQKS